MGKEIYINLSRIYWAISNIAAIHKWILFTTYKNIPHGAYPFAFPKEKILGKNSYLFPNKKGDTWRFIK